MQSNRLQKILTNPWSAAGLCIISLLVFVAVLGPLLIGEESLHINLDRELKGLEGGRLGFAENGIDILSFLVYGARISLFVSFFTTLVTLTFGVAYGAISGYFGNRVDAVMMRIVDVLLAFPGLLLAIYIASVLKPSIFNLIIALSATGWVSYARVTRAQVLSIKEREFLIAAKSLGAKSSRVIVRHILPNILGPLIVQATFGMASLILAEAALSFLGLGVPPGTPSWGALLEQGVAYLLIAPHIAISPGICIALAVLGFNFLGDGIRDYFDTKEC